MSANPTPPNIEREHLECTNCQKRTIRAEAEQRNSNTGKCAYCGGQLEPVPNIEREVLRHRKRWGDFSKDCDTGIPSIAFEHTDQPLYNKQAVDVLIEQAVKEGERQGGVAELTRIRQLMVERGDAPQIMKVIDGRIKQLWRVATPHQKEEGGE